MDQRGQGQDPHSDRASLGMAGVEL